MNETGKDNVSMKYLFKEREYKIIKSYCTNVLLL